MKVLTFIFEEVVQQARLSCIRISNNDELEEIVMVFSFHVRNVKDLRFQVYLI
jgi:hypothetical protein